MSKFFSRITKDKQDCTITLTIHKLEAEVNQPLEMSIIFERGPQKVATKKFMMQKEVCAIEIEETFVRVSGFYYDKKALKWQEKTLNLNLGFHSAEKGGKFTSMGSITVDMAEIVDQGDET